MFNRIYKNLSLALVVMLGMTFGSALTSCDDDSTDSSADPVVRYFRPNNINSADSLITEFSLGQTLVMVGENLDNIIGLKFNDREVVLNPCYITSEYLLFSTPPQMPDDITNKLYITCKNGNVIEYDAKTLMPSPKVTMPMVGDVRIGTMKEGETVSLLGNYFISTAAQPLELYLGDTKVEVAETSTLTRLDFTVPDGVNSTEATVKTAYGTFNYKSPTILWESPTRQPVAAGWGDAVTILDWSKLHEGSVITYYADVNLGNYCELFMCAMDWSEETKQKRGDIKEVNPNGVYTYTVNGDDMKWYRDKGALFIANTDGYIKVTLITVD